MQPLRRCCSPPPAGAPSHPCPLPSPLTHAPPHEQDAAREIFLAKHASDRSQRWVFGNFLFFRMHRIVDIYFVGGFGTVQWIEAADYTACKPDDIVLDRPQRTLQLLNEACSQARGSAAALAPRPPPPNPLCRCRCCRRCCRRHALLLPTPFNSSPPHNSSPNSSPNPSPKTPPDRT